MARVPMRRGRGASDTRKTVDQGAMTEFFILDKNMRELNGVKLEPGQKSVMMTGRDAAFYIANGTIGTADPSKDESAKAAVAHHQGKLSTEEKEVAREARKR